MSNKKIGKLILIWTFMAAFGLLINGISVELEDTAYWSLAIGLNYFMMGIFCILFVSFWIACAIVIFNIITKEEK